MMERLHIEKFVSQVKEWQTGTIPQLTGMVKDRSALPEKQAKQERKGLSGPGRGGVGKSSSNSNSNSNSSLGDFNCKCWFSGYCYEIHRM